MKTYLSKIPLIIIKDDQLTANEKILYSLIENGSNKTNHYYSEILGVTETCVSRWINRLKELGYIKIEVDYRNNYKGTSTRKIYRGEHVR